MQEAVQFLFAGAVIMLAFVSVRDTPRNCVTGEPQQDAGRSEAAPAGVAAFASPFEQLLADKFSPRLYVHRGDYTPKDVRIVWNDRTLVRQNVDGPDPTCSIGVPTGSNPLLLNASAYLDFPENADPILTPLNDSYSFRAGLLKDTAYAHVRKEGDFLAVQYWFYYYFNDWLADHEGDWEMIELIFYAPACDSTIVCAIQLVGDHAEPVLAAYAQHSCGETRLWGDVAKDADDPTHPLVFVGIGSHASYFESFFSRRLTSWCAVGYESTPTPLIANLVAPRIVVVPDVKNDADLLNTEFEWLAFKGRWGQWTKIGCVASCEGPTGPREKGSKWTAPYTWALRWLARLPPNIGQP